MCVLRPKSGRVARCLRCLAEQSAAVQRLDPPAEIAIDRLLRWPLMAELRPDTKARVPREYALAAPG